MTKDRIFAAARRIFAREGLSGLSIRAVAKAVGLTPMAIYRHFADKDALIDALMLDGFAGWEEIVRGIRAKDPVIWMERVLDAYLNFALRQPHRFDAAFLLPARGAHRYPQDFAQGHSPVIAMASARVEDAKAQGRLRDEPTLAMMLTLAALAQGLVSMERAGRFASERDFRALYRATMRNCLTLYSTTGRGGKG